VIWRFASTFHIFSPRFLLLRLQVESGCPVGNKPLHGVKNQENQEHILGKREVDLEVSNHDRAHGNGTVHDCEVRKLETCEEDKPKEVKGGDRCLLQISDTLANAEEIVSGSVVVKIHNSNGQEDRIDAHHAQR
jgi:hypothetical protein